MNTPEAQPALSNEQILVLFCLTLTGWFALIAMCVGIYTMFSALF